MNKGMKYYLQVKDAMRGTHFVLDYETMKDLESAYTRYSVDTDYEVISMWSIIITTVAITPEYLAKALCVEEGKEG